uniref:Uncharacterized protein n=1 Tax=Rhizophora mucronata TaxID=61149 RepID=A0A2P2QAN0_RHIMU
MQGNSRFLGPSHLIKITSDLSTKSLMTALCFAIPYCSISPVISLLSVF